VVVALMRYTFGGQVSDNVIQSPSANGNTVKVLPNQSGGTAWSAQTGGSNLTGSCLATGTDPAPVCTDSDGFVRSFQGPDGIQGLWVDFGGTRRFLKGREVGTSSDAALITSAGLDSASANLVTTPGTATRAAIDARWYVKGGTAIYVSPTGSDSNDGLSAGSAMKTLQAAINAAPASGEVVLAFGGNSQAYTSPVTITQPVKIRSASPYGTRLMFNGCDGLVMSAAASGSTLEGFEVAQATRYTTTTNTARGLVLNGTSGSHFNNLTMRDVFFDGFKTSVESYYLWASTIDNCRSAFGLIGLDVYGSSVNDFVSHGQWGTGGGAGSRAIRLNGYTDPTQTTVVGSEGWTIHDNLTATTEIGIELIGYTNTNIHDNIIDFCTLRGVSMVDNGTNFTGNNDVHDNYVAITGTGGDSGILISNSVSNSQNTYNRVSDNRVLVYSGGTCPTGINLNGNNSATNVHDNVLKGFSAQDIFLNGSGFFSCRGNICLSSAANGNIYANSGVEYLVEGNVGTFNMGGGRMAYNTVAGFRDGVAAAIPTMGTWTFGDRMRNSVPAVGSPKAWVCTVAGTPGTWVSEGNL
jgi:hypothetical protein